MGYGVGAWVLWPLTIPLATSAVVDGVKSAQANDALDHDFHAKAARDQVIAPYSNFNKLLFVLKNEYQDSFTVTLLDQESHRKIVTVRVR